MKEGIGVRKGFLIIELLIALTTISLGLIACAYMQWHSIRSQHEALEQIKAVAYAHTFIENIHATHQLPKSTKDEQKPYGITWRFIPLSMPTINIHPLIHPSRWQAIEICVSWPSITGYQRSITIVTGVMAT